MQPYRAILVPLDGSRLSEHALPLALGIARRHGAQVYLARVLDVASGAGDAADERIDRARACAESQIEALAAALRAEGSPLVATALLDVHADNAELGMSRAQCVATTLHAFARSIAIDLVVMTTHGHGGLARLWLGSVANALIHEATLPVLLVRPETPLAAQASPDTFARVLIPLDGGPLAEQVIAHALALGDPTRTQYTLLHVMNPLLAEHTIPPYAAGMPVADLAALRAQVQAYLNAVAARLRGQAAGVRTLLVVAEPADAILEVARAQRAGLIAMATHGRSILARAVLGSVADRVARNADAPVLLFRPDPAAQWLPQAEAGPQVIA